jgi:hypothetical protein
MAADSSPVSPIDWLGQFCHGITCLSFCKMATAMLVNQPTNQSCLNASHTF